jgi:uncharacterized protein
MAVYDSPEQCGSCSSKCCRYFMFEIDPPVSKSDFENIRWYLCHHNTTIYIENKKWYIHIDNACRFLDESGRCRIYEKRPHICREHNPADCEYDQEYIGDRKFTSIEELDQYISRRFSQKKKAKSINIKTVPKNQLRSAS